MIVLYFGFILLIAFDKPLLGRLLAPGLSLGIVLGARCIVCSWLLTWIYVRWANTHYDRRAARGPMSSLHARRRPPATSIGEPNARRDGVLLPLHRDHARASPAGRRGARGRPSSSTPPGARSAPAQNGFALAGDYMSAASFLGIAGLVSTTGFDGLIYSTGLARRLAGRAVPDRRAAAQPRQVHLRRRRRRPAVGRRRCASPRRSARSRPSTLYLIAQMVGAGGLIRLMFGLSYETAIVIVGRGDDRVRAVRRHDRDDVGADREGGAAARRAPRCSPCSCCRASA